MLKTMKTVLIFTTLLYSTLLHLGSALQDTLKLYTIPSFQIHLITNDPPPPAAATISNQIGSNELIQMSTLIKAATTEHLFGFIEAYLFERNVPNGIKSVELDVAVHNDWNGNTIRSDVMGHVTFSSLALKNANLDLSQSLFQSLVKAAFDNFNALEGEGDALDAFLVTIQDVIPFVVVVEVSFEENSTSSGNIPPKFIYDSETLKSDGNGVGYTTVSVAAAVVVLAAGMFVYSSKKREVVKDRHLLTYIDSYDEENGVLFDPYETSYKTEEGVQFIPVPAKKETISKEHRKYGLVPKVYVQASSPLEFVYGASFSHRDQAKVARAHGNRNFRPSKVGGKKLKKKTPLKPMSAISESLEDEGKALVAEHDEFDVSPRREGEGSFHSDVIILDIPMSMKTPVKESIEDKSRPLNHDDIEDDILSYDNLSRHDDTDCVSFSPVCDVDWSQNTSVIEELHAISPRQVRYDQDSSNGNHPQPSSTSLSLSTSPEKEVEIDNFVDKLESLIAARCRQYQERKIFGKEMDELRIIRSEQGFNSPEDKVREADYESKLNDQPASDELLDTEDIQPKELFPFEEDDEEDLDGKFNYSSSHGSIECDNLFASAETCEGSSSPNEDTVNGATSIPEVSKIDDTDDMVKQEVSGLPEETDHDSSSHGLIECDNLFDSAETCEESSSLNEDTANGATSILDVPKTDDNCEKVEDVQLEVSEQEVSGLPEETDHNSNDEESTLSYDSVQYVTTNDCPKTSEPKLKFTSEANIKLIADDQVKEITEERVIDSDSSLMDQISVTNSLEKDTTEADTSCLTTEADTSVIGEIQESSDGSDVDQTTLTNESKVNATDSGASLNELTPFTDITEEIGTESDGSIVDEMLITIDAEEKANEIHAILNLS